VSQASSTTPSHTSSQPHTQRDIRRLAFQALYQLDARRDEPAEAVLAAVMSGDDDAGDGGGGDYTPAERKKAFLLASQAFAARQSADAFMQEAAPEWPTHRQAAVDRAILRLAYYEMTSGATPAKIAVNEAVELAKIFSTEKSPAFVNGLLDKALKRVLAERADVAAAGEGADAASGAAGGGESSSSAI
jgi:transcription antitermination protein NusB